MQKCEVSLCESMGPTLHHSCPSHGSTKAESPPAHSLTLTLPLFLVHLSLLSPTLKQGRGEGKEEKGEGIGAWKQQEMAVEIT